MLKLYNTLSRRVEDFKPINPPSVSLYACGPTVYDNAHIGHMRRYVNDDILVRVLAANGYEVKHVMNITDVGHLVSDADTGEDKMEKGAKKLGLTVWEVAKKFEKQFFNSCKLLNILPPNIVVRATDRIEDQIELIKILEEKGFTYQIKDDGVYFDTTKFPNYYKLSRQNPHQLKPGARVEVVEGKHHFSDFALWKFSPKNEKRQMEWESPWGKGFPGWHIECSAIAIKELGPHFDIHTGGVDHIAIHHTNEIAQSESASGKKYVNYWVHHNHMMVENQKMSKTLGNYFTVNDIIQAGFDPLALRYLFLQTHYRQEMNFTWDALEGAQAALNKLRDHLLEWKEAVGGIIEFEDKFNEAIIDDLNTPQALAVVWEMVKSKDLTEAKAAALYSMDSILGLELAKYKVNANKPIEVPQKVIEMVKEREGLRKQKRYHLADQLRSKIIKLGFDVIDKEKTTEVKKLNQKY